MSRLARFSAGVVLAALCLPGMKAQGSQSSHVVTQQELSGDIGKVAETRQANEGALRHLLSSAAGQEALQSAHVDYTKVDTAVGQLSDEDLAKLAERSRHAEEDFAAGSISAKTLAYIILILVVVITIIVIARKV